MADLIAGIIIIVTVLGTTNLKMIALTCIAFFVSWFFKFLGKKLVKPGQYRNINIMGSIIMIVAMIGLILYYFNIAKEYFFGKCVIGVWVLIILYYLVEIIVSIKSPQIQEPTINENNQAVQTIEAESEEKVIQHKDPMQKEHTVVRKQDDSGTYEDHEIHINGYILDERLRSKELSKYVRNLKSFFQNIFEWDENKKVDGLSEEEQDLLMQQKVKKEYEDLSKKEKDSILEIIAYIFSLDEYQKKNAREEAILKMMPQLALNHKDVIQEIIGYQNVQESNVITVGKLEFTINAVKTAKKFKGYHSEGVITAQDEFLVLEFSIANHGKEQEYIAHDDLCLKCSDSTYTTNEDWNQAIKDGFIQRMEPSETQGFKIIFDVPGQILQSEDLVLKIKYFSSELKGDQYGKISIQGVIKKLKEIEEEDALSYENRDLSKEDGEDIISLLVHFKRYILKICQLNEEEDQFLRGKILKEKYETLNAKEKYYIRKYLIQNDRATLEQMKEMPEEEIIHLFDEWVSMQQTFLLYCLDMDAKYELNVSKTLKNLQFKISTIDCIDMLPDKNGELIFPSGTYLRLYLSIYNESESSKEWVPNFKIVSKEIMSDNDLTYDFDSTLNSKIDGLSGPLSIASHDTIEKVILFDVPLDTIDLELKLIVMDGEESIEINMNQSHRKLDACETV